jgi:hypothetical protein
MRFIFRFDNPENEPFCMAATTILCEVFPEGRSIL